jgi:hypothetical protein
MTNADWWGHREVHVAAAVSSCRSTRAGSQPTGERKDVQLEDTLSPAAGVHLVYLFMSLCAKFNLTKHLQNDLTKAFPQTQLEPGRTIYLIPKRGRKTRLAVASG